MPAYVGAIDQGTTSTRFIVFDRDGAMVVGGAERARADLSGARLCRARSRGDLAQHASRHRRRARGARACALRPRRGRHHQPARDHAAVGPPHRASRCTTRSSGRTRGSIRSSPSYARDGGKDRLRGKTGLPLASYFSGLKLRWLLDTRARTRGRRRRPATRSSARSIPGSSGTSPAGPARASTSPT